MHQFDTVYDVAIFGNGCCGFAAAVKLAQAGNNVILVGRRPVLGWEGTWALRLDLPAQPTGVAKLLIDKLATVGGAKAGRADAAILEIVLDEIASHAGVDLLYYSQPMGVAADGDMAVGVVVAGKSGDRVVKAKAFVDATENGLLWASQGGKLARPSATQAVHALYLNGAAVAQLPQALGEVAGIDGVTLKPGAWDGEVAVEFAIAKPDIRVARRRLPALLKALRDGVKGLERAVVTNVGTEPFPLHCAKFEPAHSSSGLKNLFGAGPWMKGDLPTIGDRMACGEECADQIAAHLPRLPVVEPKDVGEPSVVAPPAYECDAVVCGGGTAGAFAAIAAARGGAKTILIEPTTFLGGIGTGGGIHSYYHGVKGGIQDEADKRTEDMQPLFGRAGGFHPEAKKVVLQQMADEAGVEMVFDTTVTGVEAADEPTSLPARAGQRGARRVTGVAVAGPDGGALYKTRVVIDSTGDGDAAVMAGADYTFGRDKDGLPHAYSLAAGRLHPERGLMITNFDAGYCDPTDPTDLTRARRLGLVHYRRERYEAADRLVYIAPLLGLRNSRQIVGDYTLTFGDEVMGRQFPDVIGYAYSHFDNHGYDYENESDDAALWVWALGNWRRQFGCEIPFRCMLPRGIEGLIVACRAISITHDAHNQLRMQRDMQRLGEAAGVAAALAVCGNTTPRALDVAEIQKVLLETGALTLRRPKELPAPQAGDYHETSWMPAKPRAMSLDECAKQLEADDPTEATWQMVCAGADAVPLLRQALQSANPKTRTYASMALAMLRQDDAAAELIACVKERRTDQAEGHKSMPLWMPAMVMLGRVGDKAAVGALANVLEDKSASLDALVAAVRALGRIGDPSAASAIEAMLERDDLPTVRELQVSGAGRNSVRDDATWQIELAAAEVLAIVGKPRPDIAAKHKQDPRAYVRNYAAKVDKAHRTAAAGPSNP